MMILEEYFPVFLWFMHILGFADAIQKKIMNSYGGRWNDLLDSRKTQINRQVLSLSDGSLYTMLLYLRLYLFLIDSQQIEWNLKKFRQIFRYAAAQMKLHLFHSNSIYSRYWYMLNILNKIADIFNFKKKKKVGLILGHGSVGPYLFKHLFSVLK